MKYSPAHLLATCIAIVLVVVACRAAGHASLDDGADVEAIVTGLKRDLVRAYIEADTEALDRIYAEDYTVTDREGVTRTKADEIRHLATEGSTLTTGTYEPVEIRLFGDVAVMSGLGDLEGVGADGPYRHRYYSFNVFVRRDGRWQYAAAFVP